MAEFSPRLVQILFLLLRSEKPISANDLAEQLQISKRTVFRELEHVNSQLKKYKIQLLNVIRQGFAVEGSTEDKNELMALLKESDSFDPKNRDERQRKLIWLLMKEEGVQKLYYFAHLLQVSEATVSNDLDFVEVWFAMHNISLEKRAGFGIKINYDERNYRKALFSYLLDLKDNIQEKRNEQIKILLEDMESPIIQSMTKHSFESVILYLSIVVERLEQRKNVYLDLEEKQIERNPSYYQLVESISEEVEKKFWVSFTIDEKIDFYTFLKSRKIKYIQKGKEKLVDKGIEIDLKGLVFEMIQAFDVGRAFELKQDEDLIQGMISHLRPTVTRLLYKMPIQNPLLQDIKNNYIDTYNKAANAAEILKKRISCEIPEDEIAYLALHFGGALVRIEQKKRHRRKVDIGVVCASGIGISSLLSTRLVHYFEEKIRVIIITTDELDKINIDDIDMIVSTLELASMEIPFVHVAPMITEDEFEQISSFVHKFAYSEKKKKDQESYKQEVSAAIKVANEISSIMSSFQIFILEPDVTYEEVLDFAGRTIGGTKKQEEDIVQAITTRESLATQVISEYEIALFHAKTNAVDNSKFIGILPDGEQFESDYFKNIKTILVMLIPEDNQKNAYALSTVSNAIFGEDELLGFIKNGSLIEARNYIESLLHSYFEQYMQQIVDENRG